MTSIASTHAQDTAPVQLRTTWLVATLGLMVALIGVLSIRLVTLQPAEAEMLGRANYLDSLSYAPVAGRAAPAAAAPARGALPLVPVSTVAR
jgi:hypothetical protein